MGTLPSSPALNVMKAHSRFSIIDLEGIILILPQVFTAEHIVSVEIIN